MRHLALITILLAGCGAPIETEYVYVDGGVREVIVEVPVYADGGGPIFADPPPPLGECRSQRFAEDHGIVDHSDCLRPGSGGEVCNPWFNVCQGEPMNPGTWQYEGTTFCTPCSDFVPCDGDMQCVTRTDPQLSTLEQVCLPGDGTGWPSGGTPPISCKLPFEGGSGVIDYDPPWARNDCDDPPFCT